MSYREARRRFEHEFWTDLLRQTGGDVKQAARVSGRTRTDLYKVFDRYGVTNPVRRRLRGNWGDLID
jgi:two-component system response regulator GlrR